MSMKLHFCPQTRSVTALWMLEEAGAPYEIVRVNIRAPGHPSAAYKLVNPMGKVPAIRHGDAVVTEQVAVFLYLADLFPEAGLAPALTDPLRGPYLRWMVFYAACFEPALIDRSTKREAVPVSRSPYADYDTMLEIGRAHV